MPEPVDGDSVAQSQNAAQNFAYSRDRHESKEQGQVLLDQYNQAPQPADPAVADVSHQISIEYQDSIEREPATQTNNGMHKITPENQANEYRKPRTVLQRERKQYEHYLKHNNISDTNQPVARAVPSSASLSYIDKNADVFFRNQTQSDAESMPKQRELAGSGFHNDPEARQSYMDAVKQDLKFEGKSHSLFQHDDKQLSPIKLASPQKFESRHAIKDLKPRPSNHFNTFASLEPKHLNLRRQSQADDRGTEIAAAY